jgi:hypothetical protein
LTLDHEFAEGRVRGNLCEECEELGEYRKGVKVDKEMEFFESVEDADIYGVRRAWYGVG